MLNSLRIFTEIADLLLEICLDNLFVTSLLSDKDQRYVRLTFPSCSCLFVMNTLDDESYLVPPMQNPTFINHSCISELPDFLCLLSIRCRIFWLAFFLVIGAPVRTCSPRRSQARCMSGTSSHSSSYKLHDEPTLQKTSICPSRLQVGQDETVSTDQSWAF